MKVISLNIWGGTCGKELLDFFDKNKDVDIFLLQEVLHNATEKTIARDSARANIFNEIKETLPNHSCIFAPAESDEWGLAICFKKELPVVEHGDVFVYREKNALEGRDRKTFGKNMQYIKISIADTTVNILNFHGLWNGQGKNDTEDRISQSNKIVDFITDLEGRIVLMGDFNLKPETESLKMIEQKLHLNNLISKYQITSTRTSFYEKEEKYADYTLVSSDIDVIDFRILPDEVSDHSAMLLEFK